MRMNRRLLVLLSFCTLFPAAAHAQRIDSPYRFVESAQSVGPFVGYLSTGQNERELGPQSATVFGARYGIRISGPFRAEGTIGYVPTTRDIFAVDSLAADSTDRALIGEADVSLLFANAALRFDITGPRTWYRLQPFLLAGGGVAIDFASLTELEEEELPVDDRFDFGTSFAGELGAGIEWFLSDRLSMRAELRDHFWKLMTPAGFGNAPHGDDLPEDAWISNWSVSAGLSLHF